jgi:hypothetical protein
VIPFQNTGVILGVPNWVAHNGAIKHGKSARTDGWADETFLIKYRILSANEEGGNYMLTAFMGFSAPTGDDSNSNHHGVFTPTIAGGLARRSPGILPCSIASVVIFGPNLR